MVKYPLSNFLPILLAISTATGILLGYFISTQNFAKPGTQTQINKFGYVVRLLESNYVDPVSTKELVDQSLMQITEKLDPHTNYVSLSNQAIVNSSLEEGFVGVGIYFSQLGDTLLVEHPIFGGPARKAGLICGDRIVAVDDSSFVGFSFKEAFDKLRGEPGSSVKLTIKRDFEKDLIDLVVIRESISSPSVDFAYLINDTTGYIKITKFGNDTFDQFKKKLVEMIPEGINSLILDLRDNGGGYLTDATKMADEFLPSPDLIVYTLGKQKKYNERFTATDSGSFLKGHVTVLINETRLLHLRL